MKFFGSNEKPEDLIYQAMSLLKKNHVKPAISLFNSVLKQDPKNLEALHNKGVALNQIKKYSDAVTCFDAILKSIPKEFYKQMKLM